MNVPRAVVLAVAAGLLLAAAPALPTPQANAAGSPAGSLEATIDSFAFAPKELTVKAGSTVAWTNKDDTAHTVTSDDGAFASPVMDIDQQFQLLNGSVHMDTERGLTAEQKSAGYVLPWCEPGAGKRRTCGVAGKWPRKFLRCSYSQHVAKKTNSPGE